MTRRRNGTCTGWASDVSTCTGHATGKPGANPVDMLAVALAATACVVPTSTGGGAVQPVPERVMNDEVPPMWPTAVAAQPVG